MGREEKNPEKLDLSPSPPFPTYIHLRMHDPQMSGQGVVARKVFLFRAQMAADLMSSVTMEDVVVSSKVVAT